MGVTPVKLVAVILILAIAVQESACCSREGSECCNTMGNVRQYCNDGLKCCKNICVISLTSSCRNKIQQNTGRKPSKCTWELACENPKRVGPTCCYFNLNKIQQNTGRKPSKCT